MAATLRWSLRAETDLGEIYIAIGMDRPLAAERFIDRIEAACGRLVDHPRMGVRRADIGPTVRMLVEAPFLVLYETIPDTDHGPIDAIRIVRVIDGRRDLTSL